MLSSLDSQPWTIFHTHAYCSIKQWVGWGAPTYCCGSQAQGRLVAPRYTAHKEKVCQTPRSRHPEGTCPQLHPPTHRFSPSSLGTIVSCWEFLGMDFCVVCNRSGISQQDRLPETFGWFVCVCALSSLASPLLWPHVVCLEEEERVSRREDQEGVDGRQLLPCPVQA